MAIPVFDASGNLPEGVHHATVAEVRERLVEPFGGSLTRRMIFEWWRHHRRALLDLVEVPEQWLSGSFTSDKADPNDMDLVTVLDGPTFDALPRHRQLLIRPLVAGNYTEQLWQCDNHPVLSYPRDHPGRDAFEVALDRWRDHFGHDRDGSPRGFVKITGAEDDR